MTYDMTFDVEEIALLGAICNGIPEHVLVEDTAKKTEVPIDDHPQFKTILDKLGAIINTDEFQEWDKRHLNG